MPNAKQLEEKYLDPLPYPKDALEPFISAKTMEAHYEGHYKGYAKKLASLHAKEEPLEKIIMDHRSLLNETGSKEAGGVFKKVWDLVSQGTLQMYDGLYEAVVSIYDEMRGKRHKRHKPQDQGGELGLKTNEIYENACQLYNHSVFWKSLKKDAKKPTGALLNRIEKDFGSLKALEEALLECGTSHFGSGWLWLVHDKKTDTMEVFTKAMADNPLPTGEGVLGCIDLWEHSYYLDHGKDKRAYLSDVIQHLFNWEEVERRLKN